MTHIQELLFSYQDIKNRDFMAKLAPTLDKECIIGVKVPLIRGLMKNITKEEEKEFLLSLPHKYYEENLLHGFFLSKIKDFSLSISLMEEFLPYVDNWAVCDTMMPKIYNKHKKEILPYALKWIKDKHPYSVRFGIDILMNLFLDDDFSIDHLSLVSSINRKEYYINMMVAWYFATALAKKWDETIRLIEKKTLNPWIQNKTIQKALESFRVSDEHKEYLRTLKIK